MNPKHILVPFNTSSESKEAFKEALKIAKKYEAKITVVYFWTTRMDNEFIGYTSGVKFIESELFLWGLKNLPKEFQRLELKAFKEGIQMNEDIVKCEIISEGIAKYAKRHNIMLIVIGSNEHKVFKKHPIGKEASEVAKYCH